MRSEHSPLLFGVVGLAFLGACADLIGANFEPYEVEPSGMSSAAVTAASTSTDLATSTSTGDGGGGDGGGSSTASTGDTSSSSSGTSCEEWPAGSGEWKWATQVELDAGSQLDLVAVIPANGAIYPWAAVGDYVGTLFEESETEGSTDNPAPFLVALGPDGAELGGALAMDCSGTCQALRVTDAASDPSVWRKDDALLWVTGNLEGTFGTATAAAGGTPFVMRAAQNDSKTHTFANGTLLLSSSFPKGVPTPDSGGAIMGIDARDGAIGVSGDAVVNSLFGYNSSFKGFSHFFVGVAQPFPTLQNRHEGSLTTGTVDSSCTPESQPRHARDVDVAVVGTKVWTAGRFCGVGPKGGGSATDPGNGFVVVEGTGTNIDTGSLEYDDEDGEAAIQFGAPVTAIAALDEHSAVIAGEIPADDASPGLPDGSQPFADEGAVFVSLLDEDAGDLVPRWVTELDAPGDQHAIDVAVRRIAADEVEVFVAGVTDAPFAEDGFAAPCDFEGEPIAFIAKLDNDGTLVWIRTFGRDGAKPIQLRIGEEGLIVGAETGLGDYALEPRATGVSPLELSSAPRSFFVGELSF